MNRSFQAQKRYKTLRDFGAFRPDVSAFDTQKMSASYDAPTRPSGGLPVQAEAQKTQQEQRAISPRTQSTQSTQSTQRRRQRWLLFALRASVTGVLCVLLFRSVSWIDVLTALLHARLGLLLLAYCVGVTGIGVSAYQWRTLLRAELIHQDVAELINLYLVGIAFNHLLPTNVGGDAVKAFYVGRQTHNAVGAVTTSILCRLTGFCGMVLVALPVLVIWREQFALQFVAQFVLLCLLLGSFTCGTIFLAAVLPSGIRDRWQDSRILSLVVRVGHTLGTRLHRPTALGRAVGYAVVFWLVAILNCYGYASALGLTVPLHFYFLAVPFVALVAFLPISLNGMGIREAAFVYALATVHVPTTIALSLALFLDVQALSFGLVGVGIYLMLSREEQTLPELLRQVNSSMMR